MNEPGSHEWLEEIMERAEKMAEAEDGPKWMLITTFRAHTEDDAKDMRNFLQILMKSAAISRGHPIADFMMFRCEGNTAVEVVE